MSTPKPENRFANTWQLVGEKPEEADVTGDGPRSNPHEAKLPYEPKVWYARWGQAISGLFSSIGDKFTALWRGVSDAADAVARFFSGKGAASDLAGATRNINDPPKWVEKPEFSAAGQSPSSSVIYSPVPENPKDEDVPEERRGMLGAIPAKLAISTEDTEKNEVVEPAPASVLPGQEKFEAYLALRSQGSDWLEYALDEDCLQYADQVFQPLFKLQSTPGYRLTDEQRAIYGAVKDLKSAHADYKKQIKEEEQKKAQEAERIRQAEEAASKQPGQADFEEFVAVFDRHRADNTPFMIYDGSTYLREACLQYGKANSENFSDDQKSAFRHLMCWHQDPQGSKQRLEQATQFISLDEVGPQASELTEALMEPHQIDSSSPSDLDASRPPPPRPAARWISILVAMKALEPQQIKRIAGVFTMQEDQVRKAMDGLRTIAKLASASGAPAARNAGGAHTIEQVLNYDAEASRQASDLLESLELANMLVKRLSAGDALVFDQPEKEFFDSLKNVIGNVAEALAKKLAELLPARPPSKAQKKTEMQSPAKGTPSPSVTDSPNSQKPVGVPAMPKPTVVSQESIKLLSQLKSSIDAPSLIMAMYPDPSLAPDIPSIYEGALPYFDGLLMSGKIDDVAKANAQMLASLWQAATKDKTQQKKCRH